MNKQTLEKGNALLKHIETTKKELHYFEERYKEFKEGKVFSKSISNGELAISEQWHSESYIRLTFPESGSYAYIENKSFAEILLVSIINEKKTHLEKLQEEFEAMQILPEEKTEN